MESGRLCFDPYASQGNQFFLGNQRDNVFPGARTTMMMEESSKRRPFFSSPEELLDEDYYDEQLPEKKRRLSPDQVHLLEKSFETENKLEPERKTQLAKKLGLQPRQVAVWFQNRRARWKTKQLERDYDLLKTSLDSLRSNYDSLLKDNQILKSQVVSLTNKLEGKENNDGRETAGEKAADLFSGDRPAVVAAELKMEDRLSTGSGSGSAVVNDRRQFVDSSGADSYFRNEEEEYTAGGGVNRIDQSEEGDGSDDGRSYFSDDVFCATDQQQQLGWWVWP